MTMRIIEKIRLRLRARALRSRALEMGYENSICGWPPVHDPREVEALEDEAAALEVIACGETPLNPHAWKLGRKCWVRLGDGQWEPRRVVAVSHRGALDLRPWGDRSGRHAEWLPAEKAASPHVSFEEPGERA